MKNLFLSFALLCGSMAFAQLSNNNTLSVQIDGKEYKTEPRRIRVGSIWYVTANAIKPDKSLRFWFVNTNGAEMPEKGVYLVVEEGYGNRREVESLVAEGKYKGIAYVKYVEETKAPRMEYHVGRSRRNGGTVEITTSNADVIEGKFNATLDGSHYKEKASATVFGGVSRVMNKMEDKAITSATGYESDIDPEGRGYRRTDQKDEVVLKDGTFKLQLKKETK